MIATTTGKVTDYILEEERDKPESERTVFRIRTLDRKGTAVIQDSLIGYDVAGSVVVSRPGTGALVACKLGIEGWTNLLDEDGNEVRPHFITSKSAKSAKPILSPKSLNSLPQYAIDELGGAIMELNGLGRSSETEEEDDAQADTDSAEDPTDASATATGCSSPPPSPQATPKRTPTPASSATSERARSVPA